MIKKVTLQHFKMFRQETFEIADNIVLVGPNNSGKTTLLQAIAVWNLALRKWLAERRPVKPEIQTGARLLKRKSEAHERTGVPITRKDFTALPLREMGLLWTSRSTALFKDELRDGQKLGTPRPLSIVLDVSDPLGKQPDWSLGMEFRYSNQELVYAKPATTPSDDLLETFRNLQVVHVPPFSGIGAEETRYDNAYQDLLIGQGRPGEILRNLLLTVYQGQPDTWQALCKDVREIFGYEMLPPAYEGRPFILCEYEPGVPPKGKHGNWPKLDISCAGSGFLQVLMLLGFYYARPASVLLLDEPDAHLHVILQKQVYDRLRETARRRGCQLLIATHSEVLVDGTSPDRILSFFMDPHPHRLEVDAERGQVREALKRLTSLDLLMAEQSPGILYVEGESDLNLLREWAGVLKHDAYPFLAHHPFWHSNQGRNPREARDHFFALQAVRPLIRGVLILDGDNRQLSEHELHADGLTVLRWKRYEAESYLVHPKALERFLQGEQQDLFTRQKAEKGMGYLRNELAPGVLKDPLGDHDYLNATAASKTLLPGFFKAAGVPMTKNEYYQIAAQMRPEEIPDEVREKLDAICKLLGIKTT